MTQRLQPASTATRRKFIAGMSSAVATCSVSSALVAGWRTRASYAAEIGGELVTMEWAGYSDDEASAPFREQFNVSVTVNPITNPDEIIPKLLAGAGRNVSLVTPATWQIPQIVEAGVIAPMDYGRVPSTNHYIPFISKAAKAVAVDGQTYCAPYIWGFNALLYNEKYVVQAPKSWMDLTKPEFANKIALSDNAADNISLWAKVLGFDGLNMTQPELDKVTDFLINLKRTQARTFTSVYDDMAQQLATGDIVAIASPVWSAVVGMARKNGGDAVKWTLPAEGGLTWIDAWVLPKDGANPDTAYAWIDYMLSGPAQAIVAPKLASGTVSQDAIPLLSEEARTALPYDNLALLEERAPLFTLPLGTNGTVTYSDWVRAWKRVVAA